MQGKHPYPLFREGGACRALIGFWRLQDSSQLPVAAVSGEPKPSSGLHGHQTSTWCALKTYR